MSLSNIRRLTLGFQFKAKYLSLHIPERRLLIEECIRYLETTEDTASKNWFMVQKNIHDDPTDEFRKSEVVSHNNWNEFYALLVSSTPLCLIVETFLEHA